MGIELFLCEKPDQAKAVAQGLGALSGRKDGFYQKGNTAVTWCFGHMLTQAMPAAYGEQFVDFGNIAALPILPSQWQMEVPKKVAKQFSVIKKLLQQADTVIIATDADREGEVIAREILDFCGYRKKILRFWTSGLDTTSVKKALGSLIPGEKKLSLYQAGLARSRADWLVGMNLSRAYTVAYSSGFGAEHTLSIGRIQTPTLNLVVLRDLAIEHFKPYPYYTLTADFQTASSNWTAHWQIPETLQNSDGVCTDKEFVQNLAAKLERAHGHIRNFSCEQKRTPPPLPYSLSALQKEAGKRFGLSAAKVLDLAQSLYERHKIVSYPRSPCQYLPKSQQNEVADVLAAIRQIDPSISEWIDKSNPNKESRVWNDAQVNKHSHHAIIPTSKSSFDLKELNHQEREIYFLIRNRYIAQFLPDYEYESRVIVTECCDQLFKATGQQPISLGWRSLLLHQDEKDENSTSPLPNVRKDETVKALYSHFEQKKTTPPPRFTEPSLLDEMQSLSDFFKSVDDGQIKKILRSTQGLGTEATRANIIERLFEMGYLEKKRGKVLSTEKGRNLIARIPKEVADPVTTAKWELALASIEEGKLRAEDFLDYQAGWITQLVAQAKIDAARNPKFTRKS